ncbi:MAG: hypothetical protein ACI8P3_001143, partial [Saprospiraceae bacterium]
FLVFGFWLVLFAIGYYCVREFLIDIFIYFKIFTLKNYLCCAIISNLSKDLVIAQWYALG